MQKWSNKVVVVAGGSRGLGFAIAKAFCDRGAKVILLARDVERLNAAVSKLESDGGRASGHAVDLLHVNELASVVGEIISFEQRIDVWVNAVGQSTRIEFENATDEQYRKLMDQNFFAAVNGTQSALAHVKQTDGHIVNIGSLASRTAWPFVAPYVTAKHALAGYASQLRLEGPTNIHYLFVCPGPIAADDSDPEHNRYDVTSQMSEMASKPGAGAPTKLIDPHALAAKIVAACESRKPELVVPAKSRILFGLLQFWPRLGQALLRRIARNK